MEAVILRNGFAVRTINLINPKNAIDGFLSSFKINSIDEITNSLVTREYTYLTTNDISGISDEKIEFSGISGYYEVDAYANFMSSPTQYGFDKLNTTYRFDNKFIDAETDDNIQVEIVYIGEPPMGYYYYRKYNFTHIKGKNYLKKDNAYELDLTLMGTPSTPNHIDGTPVSNGFYDRHIAQLSTVVGADKFQYSLNTVRCAIRIEQIESEIFPILLYNPPSQTFDLSNIINLTNDLSNHWKDKVCYESFNLLSAKNYNNILVNFFYACFRNQDIIKNSNQEDRLRYLLQALPTSISSILPVPFFIATLKSIINKKDIDENEIDAIIKIVMSFNENDPVKIDDFLENLISQKNSIIIEQTIRENNFVGSQNTSILRDKQTLYEAVIA